MESKERILSNLADAIVNMEEEAAVELAEEAIAAGIPPEIAIMEGLAVGMERVSELFDSQEYFVPEVIVCADTMYAALKILRPENTVLKSSRGKIVIGVVEGDTHDIGKNIVSIMLEGAGFTVYDIGRDVPAYKFIDKAIEVDADIIALSSLMTTTMRNMKVVIENLKKSNIKNMPFVIVGGGPVSNQFADSIGADGYSVNAPEAVKLAIKLMERK
jgi:dimethylamine corrinoid protein